VFDAEWSSETGGAGTVTSPNGDVYTGQFDALRKDGMGKISSRDGSSYEGSWKADQRVGGAGKLVMANKTVYVGNFSADKPHGAGVMTGKNHPFLLLLSLFALN
jgi:hypothetical protein